MPEPASRPAARRGWAAGALVIAIGIAAPLAACEPSSSATPRPATPSAAPASAAPSLASSSTASPTGSPTPTPEPALSLDLPQNRDQRRVRISIVPDLAQDSSGRVVVTVESLADTRIVELVLRWPTELRDTLFLAPFEPAQQRIANGGPPLWQAWTKWVEGPGERGEPAGTTSLGWGPLDAGATLTIPLIVTRNASGPVAFDFQVLAGDALLQLEDGEPAELRVELP